jgi:hypothetical protein
MLCAHKQTPAQGAPAFDRIAWRWPGYPATIAQLVWFSQAAALWALRPA